MKNIVFYVCYGLMLCVFTKNIAAKEQGVVSFDVGPYPGSIEGNDSQVVKFLGCGVNRNVSVKWGQSTKISDVPYKVSHKACANNECTASKYYLASPPVDFGKQKILGQLTPDHFKWSDKDLHKTINMSYSVIEPLTFGHINADFTFKSSKKVSSCDEQKIDLVPINIHCPNLPQNNGKVGASGIGFIENKAGKGAFFVPLAGAENDDLIECSIVIIDDILPTHEVFFEHNNQLTRTISMTEYYNKGNTMQFVCQQRNEGDIPSGCK